MNYQNNPKGRQMFILDELKLDSSLSYSVMFGKFSEMFGKSDKTFDKDWLSVQNDIKQYTETINKAKLEESISIEKEAVRNGLKTKNERLLILQKLVDECLEQLATKQCNDTIIVEGTVKNIKRLMNQRELNDTRKTLQSLQSEISKIEGDYAVTKTENVNTFVDAEVFDWVVKNKK